MLTIQAEELPVSSMLSVISSCTIAALVDGCQIFNIALWLLDSQPRAVTNEVKNILSLLSF